MELEALASSAITDKREWLSTLERFYASADTDNKEIHSGPFLKMMLARSKEPRARLARDFHAWLAAAFTARAVAAARMTGVSQIVLSGGCMQNRLLLEALFHLLREEKMEVFAGELLPMNDGGLAAGQALVGGIMASTEKKSVEGQ
jgi:hydrogenase maturation factor HypF (carbamoyltransferase family)